MPGGNQLISDTGEKVASNSDTTQTNVVIVYKKMNRTENPTSLTVIEPLEVFRYLKLLNGEKRSRK